MLSGLLRATGDVLQCSCCLPASLTWKKRETKCRPTPTPFPKIRFQMAVYSISNLTNPSRQTGHWRRSWVLSTRMILGSSECSDVGCTVCPNCRAGSLLREEWYTNELRACHKQDQMRWMPLSFLSTSVFRKYAAKYLGVHFFSHNANSWLTHYFITQMWNFFDLKGTTGFKDTLNLISLNYMFAKIPNSNALICRCFWAITHEHLWCKYSTPDSWSP